MPTTPPTSARFGSFFWTVQEVRLVRAAHLAHVDGVVAQEGLDGVGEVGPPRRLRPPGHPRWRPLGRERRSGRVA